MTNQNRVNAGVPTGGQFASHDRSDADATLPAPFDPENPEPIGWEGENVSLRFVYIGEGYEGEYDPENPDDIPMFRIDTLVRRGAFEHVDIDGEEDDEWDVPAGGSYCTGLPTDTDPEKLAAYLRRMGTRIERAITFSRADAGEVIRVFAERISDVTDNNLDQLASSTTLFRLDRALSDQTRISTMADGTLELHREVELSPQYDTGELTLNMKVKVDGDEVRVELTAVDNKVGADPRLRVLTHTDTVETAPDNPSYAAISAAVAAIDDYLTFTA